MMEVSLFLLVVNEVNEVKKGWERRRLSFGKGG